MSPSPSADVVVLTALKDEYDQVLAVDEGAVGAQWTEEQGPLGRPVARRAFQAGDGAPLVIVATWATTMGATAAASVGSALVASYQPWCVAMCGICAGRPGEVALGDVVFAAVDLGRGDRPDRPGQCGCVAGDAVGQVEAGA